tara:strand:+ start:7698 stop:9038 length:1341 start_codon:yes stop_codon:yes gene_type:complete
MAFTSPAGFDPAMIRNLDMSKYVDLGSYINEVNKPDNRDSLVSTYGNQGITGFLQMVGAVKAQAVADEVVYWEEARLHAKQAGATLGTTGLIITVDTSASQVVVVRENDVILNGSDRFFVSGITANATVATDFDIALVALDGTSTLNLTAATAVSIPVVGNLHAQGSDQPSTSFESNLVKRSNPFMIMKEVYKVSGSAATNIGWIDLGQGDYRWYIKSEADTRQRFLDKREMMLLLGEKTSAVAGISGSEGYFAAIEDRGIVASGVDSDFASLADLDAILIELDKQGGAAEYAMYVNRTTDLAIDDMVANGVSAGTTAGIAGQFGAFNNDKDMAVALGFRTFSRGGYTFHKHDFKLLNDPTLLADADYAGVMIPMTKITDAKTGEKAPALEMNYKAANGYSRELEHWMTGSILGAKTGTEDSVSFNYRSELNLITRAANRHVLLKK